MPVELSGLPQPRGVNGWKLLTWPVISGRVSTRNRVSAATLIATSTAFTRALSLVPMISRAVTTAVIRMAGTLMKPPTSPPSRKPPKAIFGPTVIAWGI